MHSSGIDSSMCSCGTARRRRVRASRGMAQNCAEKRAVSREARARQPRRRRERPLVHQLHLGADERLRHLRVPRARGRPVVARIGRQRCQCARIARAVTFCATPRASQRSDLRPSPSPPSRVGGVRRRRALAQPASPASPVLGSLENDQLARVRRDDGIVVDVGDEAGPSEVIDSCSDCSKSASAAAPGRTTTPRACRRRGRRAGRACRRG